MDTPKFGEPPVPVPLKVSVPLLVDTRVTGFSATGEIAFNLDARAETAGAAGAGEGDIALAGGLDFAGAKDIDAIIGTATAGPGAVESDVAIDRGNGPGDLNSRVVVESAAQSLARDGNGTNIGADAIGDQRAGGGDLHGAARVEGQAVGTDIELVADGDGAGGRRPIPRVKLAANVRLLAVVIGAVSPWRLPMLMLLKPLMAARSVSVKVRLLAVSLPPRTMGRNDAGSNQRVLPLEPVTLPVAPRSMVSPCSRTVPVPHWSLPPLNKAKLIAAEELLPYPTRLMLPAPVVLMVPPGLGNDAVAVGSRVATRAVDVECTARRADDGGAGHVNSRVVPAPIAARAVESDRAAAGGGDVTTGNLDAVAVAAASACRQGKVAAVGVEGGAIHVDAVDVGGVARAGHGDAAARNVRPILENDGRVGTLPPKTTGPPAALINTAFSTVSAASPAGRWL